MPMNPYEPGTSEIRPIASEVGAPKSAAIGSIGQTAWRGARVGALIGAAIALVPALALAAFGVGSGQGLSAPIVYAYGILFVAYLGGLGGIIAGALGLIGAIFRIAVLGRRSASAAADAEPAAALVLAVSSGGGVGGCFGRGSPVCPHCCWWRWRWSAGSMCGEWLTASPLRRRKQPRATTPTGNGMICSLIASGCPTPKTLPS